MSDTPLPSDGPSDAEIADRSVQREWDRYAMPDLSAKKEPHSSPTDPPPSSSAYEVPATRFYDSYPAFGSTTALGEAFARAESAEAEGENPPPRSRRGN